MPDQDGKTMGFDPLHDEAVRWVSYLATGEASDADTARLAAWRALSPAHEAAFRRAMLAWRFAGAALLDEANARAHRRIGRRQFLAGGAAAGIVGWSSMELGFIPDLDAFSADYATGIGEQRQLAIASRHSVHLSADSALTHADASGDAPAARRANGADRLKLIKGSAYFNVGPEAPPLVVAAGDGAVIAAHGAFAITIAPDAVVVSCESGTATVVKDGPRLLKPAQRILYNKAGCSRPAPVRPEGIGAWRNGLLVVEDRPLASVVDTLNRHRTGHVFLVNQKKARQLVTRAFDLTQPEGMLRSLVADHGLVPTRLPAGIVILA